jgi:hypothetical protein
VVLVNFATQAGFPVKHRYLNTSSTHRSLADHNDHQLWMEQHFGRKSSLPRPTERPTGGREKTGKNKKKKSVLTAQGILATALGLNPLVVLGETGVHARCSMSICMQHQIMESGQPLA